MSRVPVGEIVHVRTRVHWRPLGSHTDVPQGAGRGGGGRRRGQVLSLGSTRPILHNLLVFGALVLEPYLHLEVDEGKTKALQTLARSFLFFKIDLKNAN